MNSNVEPVSGGCKGGETLTQARSLFQTHYLFTIAFTGYQFTMVFTIH